MIHKSKKSCYTLKMEVLCGRWVRYKETSYAWKDVTCKRCLKLRGREKRTRLGTRIRPTTMEKEMLCEGCNEKVYYYLTNKEIHEYKTIKQWCKVCRKTTIYEVGG